MLCDKLRHRSARLDKGKLGGGSKTNTVAIKPAIVAGDCSGVGNPFSLFDLFHRPTVSGARSRHSERSWPNKQIRDARSSALAV